MHRCERIGASDRLVPFPVHIPPSPGGLSLHRRARRTGGRARAGIPGGGPSDGPLVPEVPGRHQPVRPVGPTDDDRRLRVPFVRQIAHLPRVRRLACAEALNAETLNADGSLGTLLLTQVELVTSTDGLFGTQDRVTITEGRPTDPARADEIVASPAAAALFHLRVGSRFRVGIVADDQSSFTPPYRTIDLLVVGIGVFGTQVIQDDVDRGHTGLLLGTPASPREFAPCCTSLTYDGLQLAGGSRDDAIVEHEYSQAVSAAFRGGHAQLQVYNTAAIEGEAQRAIRPEAIALGVFGAIAALAVLVVGTQAVSRQIRAGADEVGVLRTLGAGPKVTATDGLVGAVGALIVGALVAGAITVGLSPLSPFGPVRSADPSPGIDVDWVVLGPGVLVLVAVLAGVAAVICYRQMPHRGTVPTRPSGAARVAVTAGLPISGVAGLRFALEPGRGRTTVPDRSAIVGAVLAVVVVIATITFSSSLGALISRPALYGWNFGAALFSTDGYGPIPTAIVDPLLAHDRTVSGGHRRLLRHRPGRPPGHAGHRGARSCGDRPSPPLRPRGRRSRPDRARIGHDGRAAPPDRGHRDTAGRRDPTRAPADRRDGHVADDRDDPGRPPLDEHGSALLHRCGPRIAAPAVRPVLRAQRHLRPLRPGTPPGAGRRSLERIAAELAAVARSPQIVAASGSQSLGLTFEALPVQRPAEIVNYRSIGTTPGLLAGGLAAGAVAALALTLVASVRRRRRELALLKTLGFTRRQLAAAVTWQASIVATLGLVFGVPLGVALGRWLWVLFAHQLSAVAEPTVPMGSVALVGVLALVLANVVAALPGRIAARTPAALLLRSEVSARPPPGGAVLGVSRHGVNGGLGD